MKKSPTQKPGARKPRARPISQKDLAKVLQVDQSSISLAFNHPEELGTELHQRILATAEKLGYRPNHGARAMRSGRFNQVLLVQSANPTLSWLPIELLHGLQAGLEAQRRSLLVARFPDAALVDDLAIPRALSELMADGLLINYDTNFPPELAELVVRHRLPAIWCNTRQAANCVHPDDEQAGVMLADHLLALGHRRIAYVDLFLRHDARIHYSRRDRLAGVSRACQAHRVRVIEMIPDAPVPHTSMSDWAMANLQRLRPTAVIAYGQTEAASVVHACTRLGLAIPRDLSLVAVHHELLFCGIPISIACSPLAELGRLAVSELLTRIEAPQRARPPQALPYAFHAHGSTAAPLPTPKANRAAPATRSPQ